MVSGVVTRVLAASTYGVYIERDGYSAYVFCGYSKQYGLVVGNEVRLTANVSQYNGLLELSNIKSNEIEVISTDNESTPQVITIDQVNENMGS